MNSSQPPKLIGLSGTFASGKDTLSHFLVEERNFLHIPTSSMLTEEAMRKYGNADRPAKAATAKQLRKDHGGGILVKLALDKIAKDSSRSGAVISGLRSLGEAKAIEQAGGVIIFVDAPIETRYQRMVRRERDAEASLSLEEFKQREQKEWFAGSSDADFNLQGIKQNADVIINNVGTPEDLNRQARRIFEDLGIK